MTEIMALLSEYKLTLPKIEINEPKTIKQLE
jgi:hypothetical protein